MAGSEEVNSLPPILRFQQGGDFTAANGAERVRRSFAQNIGLQFRLTGLQGCQRIPDNECLEFSSSDRAADRTASVDDHSNPGLPTDRALLCRTSHRHAFL